MGQQRESLEYKVMAVVFDDCGDLCKKVSRRCNGDSIVEQLFRIIRVWVTLFDGLLSWVDPVTDSSATRFGRAAAEGTVVHFARVIEPKVLVETIRVTDLAGELLHRAVVVHFQFFVGGAFR